jgi:hypothetical protein
MSHIMYLSPSSIHDQKCLAPSLGPIIPSRRHRKGPNEHLQASTRTRKRNRHTPRIAWDRDEREDGRRLASDPTVALPGEGRCRIPRLERQGAFCAPPNWDISDTDAILDDIALYRLGILYDDEEDENQRQRGSGFCLDSIVPDEPIYSLRPAKRAKRTHDQRPLLKEEDLHLSVELLSTYLGEDSAIARYSAPIGTQSPRHFDRSGSNNDSLTKKTGSTSTLPMIYEVAESSPLYFPSSPAADDFPELISDTEGERGEHDGDGRPGGDWALVLSPTNHDCANQSDRHATWSDTDIDDIVTDGDEETADITDSAWVFLAGVDS